MCKRNAQGATSRVSRARTRQRLEFQFHTGRYRRGPDRHARRLYARRGRRLCAGLATTCRSGAATLLIGSEGKGKSLGLTPRARIVAAALAGSDPAIRVTGQVVAARKALARASLCPGQIDLFEVTEAFAAVVLRFM